MIHRDVMRSLRASPSGARPPREATKPPDVQERESRREGHAERDAGRPGPTDGVRRLKVFAFDPALGRTMGNILTLEVPCERLSPGPVGEYVAVVDLDEVHGRHYPGVDLEDPEIASRDGLDPSELDIRFHQQMVYAVASHTIDLFQRALGRPVRWRWGRGGSRGTEARLRIYPHANQDLNAYYLPEEGKLVFGYVPATSTQAPASLPDQIVYTCLSYDVIAHEAVHPLLDSLLLDCREPTSIDAIAFQEAFADLITLLQHFDFEEALLETVRRTGGLIHRLEFPPAVQPVPSGGAMIHSELAHSNPLLELSRVFGQALGQNALRNALQAPPNPSALEKATEPHERGAILVAAVFDALFTVYNRRTADLMRLAGPAQGRDLHPDLALRLVREASKTARHFCGMSIRALDYCPPFDVQFGDFLRAMITADHDLVPDDPWGYRSSLIEAFRSRGIRPEGSAYYSEEALLWPAVEWPAGADEPRCEDLRMSGTVRHVRKHNGERILAFVNAHRRRLGLAPRADVDLGRTMVRRSHKVGPSGRLQAEFVAEVTQTRRVRLHPHRTDSEAFDFRGGLKLILDEEGSVRYVIGKPLTDTNRLQRAIRYLRIQATGGWPPPTEETGPRKVPPAARADPLVLRPRRRTRMTERVLKAYAFDPTRGRTLGNHLELRIPCELLERGPIGRQIAVIDYDPANGRYYDPVDLTDPALVRTGGLAPSETDPKFHQQMVYAVVSDTIQRFEFALGRSVTWRWARANRTDPLRNRLRIFPHALQEANAYYDPALGALLFGYFPASESEAGASLPGQVVFTCLSHDIVVHEATHAVLDNVQPFFLEQTSADAPAFHEAFGDIIALFQHFSFQDALLETIQRTGGRIHASQIAPELAPDSGGALIQAELSESNPMVDLARQFGEAMGTRAALRAALGTKPGSRTLAGRLEPHDRGSILVAAVFDAFFTVYVRRTRDLMRLARAAGAGPAAGDLHPDLALRLAREASKTARHFVTICIRALDYCPPIDIRFGDFLRALITSDAELVPDDPWGYRAAFIDAFRSRGIYPRRAASFSEESLKWERVDEARALRCRGLQLNARGPQARKANAVLLSRFGKRHATALGLSAKAPVQAHRFHSLASERVDPRGRRRGEFLVQLIQRRREPLFLDEPDGPAFTFRGGTAIVMDEEGTVRYLIGKSLDNADRLEQQREYLTAAGSGVGAALAGPDFRGVAAINLAALHRGY